MLHTIYGTRLAGRVAQFLPPVDATLVTQVVRPHQV